MTATLEVENLTVRYRRRGGRLRSLVAVDRVSFNVEQGTTFGLVGESGSGKTTVGRAVLGLVKPASGSIKVSGQGVRQLSFRAEIEQARNAQVIFQDPVGSLNPARRIIDTLREPLRIHAHLDRAASMKAAEELGEQVSLPPSLLRRLPHQLSGGQCQRVAIARALAPRPRLVVCDEPVTALDVSTQAQVVNLLADLQAETGVALLFISHDISVVRHMSHRIGVMYAGRIVEMGDAATVADQAAHPYTKALLAAIPVPDPLEQRKRREARRTEGSVFGEDQQPASGGCPYRMRCPWETQICATDEPPLKSISDGHLVACHNAESVIAAGQGPAAG